MGLLFTGLSTGLSVYSAIQQGRIAKSTANYNAANLDAERANLAVEDDMRQREFGESVRRGRANQSRSMATLKAKLAATGVQSTTGSPLALIGDTASAFQLAVSDAARSATLDHRRTLIAQNSLTAQAAMTRFQGKQAAKAGTLAAFGAAFQGASQMYGMASESKYLGASPLS